MLLEFSVGNYRSIKEIQTISFVATPTLSKYKEVDIHNVFQVTPKVRLLKSLAIYGANASGKSNLIKALETFKAIIKLSVENKNIIDRLIMPFALSTQTENQPTYFQVFFQLNSIIYRYGFEVTVHGIVSEWLFGTPNEREVFYFKRTGQSLEMNKKHFSIKFKNLLEHGNVIFRENALLLSTLAAFNEELSIKITAFFEKIIIITGVIDELVRKSADTISLKSDTIRQKVFELLKLSDIGLEGMQILEIPNSNHNDSSLPPKPESDPQNRKKVLTFHKKFDEKGDFMKEAVIFDLDFQGSEGTRRLYALAPFIFITLSTGGQLIIDEFDARLHPRLSKKIIEIFNNPETNPKNAQLLVATHDTNLLSAQLLRRDQILFVEKDKLGVSHLYSLAQFKGIRNDASFEQDYLLGRYGAVPTLNHLNSLFE